MAERRIGPQAPTVLEVVHCPKCGATNPVSEFGVGAPIKCRTCFTVFQSRDSDIFLVPVHYYWAVSCKRCAFVIALKPTKYRAEIASITAWVKAFHALCPACKSEAEYQGRDVILWASPPPTAGFIPNAAFLQID